MDPRAEERIAINESRFRQVNEAIERGQRTAEGPIGFVCECGQLGCNEVIELEHAEYEGVRRSPRRFLLVDGHQTPIDETIERYERHVVVVKTGHGGEVAEELDPREGA